MKSVFKLCGVFFYRCVLIFEYFMVSTLSLSIFVSFIKNPMSESYRYSKFQARWSYRFFNSTNHFFYQPKLSHKIFNCFSKENAQKKLHFRCFAQDFHVNCLFSELPISNKNSYQMLLYVNAFTVLYLLSFINWFFFTSCKIQSYISRTFIQNVRFFLTTFS